MMRRPLALAGILAFCLAALVAYGHHGPANVTIDAAAAKQPPVPFSHGKHASSLVTSCDTCHHTDKGLTKDTDKNVQKCSACHLDPKPGVPSMREASLQKNPFHTPLCISCHREQKKGPVVCTGCHVKK
jgi:hypothetical protein